MAQTVDLLDTEYTGFFDVILTILIFIKEKSISLR
jgi:hypothetical protein